MFVIRNLQPILLHDVYNIVYHFAHLLTLPFTTRVGDEALIAVAQCSSLQYLNVSGCHQIGDAGLIAIARGCPQLSYLDVSVLQVCSLFLSLLFPPILPNKQMHLLILSFWQV